jgi:hypothetical protein
MGQVMIALNESPVRPPSSTPVPRQPSDPRPPRLQLSATQLIASALATVTATIAASYLGLSGTVIGAAVASVVTVLGNAVYSHSIRRTGARVRTVVPLGGRWAPPEAREQDLAPTRVPRPVRPRRPGMRPWQQVSIATVAVFAALLAALTGVELALGKPLTDVLRGTQAQGGTTLLGTSLLGTSGGGPSTPAPATTIVTMTVTPSVVVTTPTITQTAPAVTATTTPTVTASSSAAPSPPSSTDTAVPSPSSSPAP